MKRGIQLDGAIEPPTIEPETEPVVLHTQIQPMQFYPQLAPPMPLYYGPTTASPPQYWYTTAIPAGTVTITSNGTGSIIGSFQSSGDYSLT